MNEGSKFGIVYQRTQDLKADNVLVTNKGHNKIVDFGMAVEGIFGDKTARGVQGTLPYMAPEVIKDKEYDAGIDWWSLGITIYKMATGSHPFFLDNDLSKFTNAILYKEPCIPKWLNKELQDLLRQVASVDFSMTIEQPLSFLESIKYKMSARYFTPASQLEQPSHLWTSRNLCHSQAQPMAINYPCHPAPLSASFGPFGFPVQPYVAYLPHVSFYQQPLPPVPYNLHPFFGPVIRPPPVPVLVPVSHNLPLDVVNTPWPFPTHLQ